jgi:hypothetical protein
MDLSRSMSTKEKMDNKNTNFPTKSFLCSHVGDSEDRELFETLEGEHIEYQVFKLRRVLINSYSIILLTFQLLEVSFIFCGQRESVLVFLTNYRIIIKSKSFTETWMVSFFILSNILPFLSF